uniref:receptor protein serine/threonine kinase n=1 Tax=Glossina brevipalpis TaxID=37001 RepID=A0A1A9WJF2_9MUSC
MIGAFLPNELVNQTKEGHSTYRNLTCYCHGDCPNNLGNNICRTRPGGYCFTAVVQNEFTKSNEFTYGCMPPHQNGGWFMCFPKHISCCDTEDYCNKNITIAIASIKNESMEYNIPVLGIIIIGLILMMVMVALLVCKKQAKLCITCSLSREERTDQAEGSDRGTTRLKQRSIAHEIQFENLISRGGYGQIYLGRWRNEKVAVKIFHEEHKASWENETEIYRTVLLPHENILHYIASDLIDIQMLLITEYYENGSLYDFLSNETIETDQLQLLAFSLILGLSHLHKEIIGNPGKPGIAHRDIKSKNILVKNNGQCSIADFGFAIKYLSTENDLRIKGKVQVGTVRYMAPEILNATLNQHIFDEYKQADMYAISLVLWEMIRRCRIVSVDTKLITYDDYALPYYDVVPADPSIEDMRTVVCDQGLRPSISALWQENKVLSTISKVMEECWNPNPAARLTALRAKKTIQRLDGDLTESSMEIL